MLHLVKQLLKVLFHPVKQVLKFCLYQYVWCIIMPASSRITRKFSLKYLLTQHSWEWWSWVLVLKPNLFPTWILKLLPKYRELKKTPTKCLSIINHESCEISGEKQQTPICFQWYTCTTLSYLCHSRKWLFPWRCTFPCFFNRLHFLVLKNNSSESIVIVQMMSCVVYVITCSYLPLLCLSMVITDAWFIFLYAINMKSASHSSNCGRPHRSYNYLINSSPRLLLKMHHLNSCSLAVCILMKVYATSYVGVLYTKTKYTTKVYYIFEVAFIRKTYTLIRELSHACLMLKTNFPRTVDCH